MLCPVPQTPPSTRLARLVVNNPVSAQHGREWAGGLAHLIGYCTTPVTEQTIIDSASSASPTFYVAYTKRPGINLLRIGVEARAGAATASRGRLAVTAQTSLGVAATTSWLFGRHDMDGTGTLSATSTVLADRPVITCYLDISALTNGTVYDLKFVWTDTAGSKGLLSFCVHEQPLGSSDPIASSDEPGIDINWTRARQGLYDGTSTTPRGLQRVLGQLAVARAQCPRQGLQLSTIEDTTYAWHVTAINATPTTAVPFGTGSTPKFRVRARGLYGTASTNPYLLRLRYQTSTTNHPVFRVAVTPVGGAVTNYDFTLASSSGVWVAKTTDNASANMVVSLPTTGTNQECWVQFYAVAATSSTPTAWVSQIALTELET